MQQSVQKISSQQARNLFPLQKLTPDDTEELLRTAIVTHFKAGSAIFRSNDVPKHIFYLIQGEIDLLTHNKSHRLIKSGTATAKKPLGRGIAGQIAATASQDSLIVRIDADMLELFLSWTNPNAYLVNEIQSHHGMWIEQLLQSRGLLRFSEEHIQTLLNRMSEVHHQAGDIVIRQDDRDEYYYIIKSGRCNVTRQPQPGAKVIKLAELRQGDAFGEEALLANTRRSANIIMLEDGELMRLAKADFSKLLAEPLLNSVSWNDSHNLLTLGGNLLDVRLPEEFNEHHLPDSINIPLPLLRLKLKQLNQQQTYIVCCNDGSRSTIATFLLNRHGFNAFLLDGGLTATAHHHTPPQIAANKETHPWNNHIDIDTSTSNSAAFNDAPHIESIHKIQPVTQHSPQTLPILQDIVVLHNPLTQYSKPIRKNLWIRSSIAITIAATTVALALAISSPADRQPTPPAPAPSATTADTKPNDTQQATYTPWSDSAENHLSNLVSAP